MTKKPRTQAYNPLDKINLAKSIEFELLESEPQPLAALEQIGGAGVYVIYYTGPFEAYAPITARNQGGAFKQPIYIGKAIPKGGRKGGISGEPSVTGKALGDRLRQHASSIQEAENLDIADFYVRHLVVDDIWIPLGENMLIETFKPVWNRAIDGFGNKDPGTRRATQFRSPWDVLHPGRSFTHKLAQSPATPELLLRRVGDYFAGRPLTPLPKAVAKQLQEEETEAEDAADEV